MNTELTNLLEELDNLKDNEIITVQILKQLINNSFKKQAEFEKMRDEAMGDIMHDMP